MSNKTIFVSIASYRDFYCTRTLESLFKNATNPNNVFVGLCIQNKDDDEDCSITNVSLKQYANNVRTIRLKSYEAKGPTWARYLCTTLMNKEDYFLQIDSHTLFEKGWDEKCIQMVEEIKANTTSKDVVLSHYPPNYDDYNNRSKDLNVVDTICQSFFNDRGVVSFLGASPINMKTEKYVQTPHIAAGMFFCEGKCIQDVPYDPNLPNLFVGEEILHSARVWTAGYDIYSPTQVVVYHLYTRSDQPHIWDDKKGYNDSDAVNKVKFLLKLQDDPQNPNVPEHLKENIDKYGLGNKRTLEEFYSFAGIDTKGKKIYKNFCPKPHEINPTNTYDNGAPVTKNVEKNTVTLGTKNTTVNPTKDVTTTAGIKIVVNPIKDVTTTTTTLSNMTEGFAEKEEDDEKEGFQTVMRNMNLYIYDKLFYFILMLLLLIVVLFFANKYNAFEKVNIFVTKNLFKMKK
jgi:hypothetical protein